MDRVIPIKSIVLGVVGVAIMVAEPFGYWSSVAGLSIVALASFFTFQAQNPVVGIGSQKQWSLKEEITPIEECKKEAKKSLLGAVLVFTGLVVVYIGSSSQVWLLTTIVGFAILVVGAVKTAAYIGCVSRLNNKRKGKF